MVPPETPIAHHARTFSLQVVSRHHGQGSGGAVAAEGIWSVFYVFLDLVGHVVNLFAYAHRWFHHACIRSLACSCFSHTPSLADSSRAGNRVSEQRLAW